MKTKDRQIVWHLFLVVVVFLLLMPIVFAISNSFKTMQEAFNTVFQVIPLHPTLENCI
jgi:sn-glycerol 3-phosphate transport system permease protein